MFSYLLTAGSSKWNEFVFESANENPNNDFDETSMVCFEDQNEVFEYGTDTTFQDTDNSIKLWVPRFPDTKKPKVGKVYQTLAQAEQDYRDYASIVGLDVRTGTSHTFARSKVISVKWLRCSKEGYKNELRGNRKRTTSSDRCGCNARISFKYMFPDSYVVSSFIEEHTHDMLPNYAHHLLKRNRRMAIGHKKFMISCAKANLGPFGSHKLLKEIMGGYMNVNSTAIDFKNYKRDLMANIKDADAQMLINKLKIKQERHNEFYFEYIINELNELTKSFWSDPILRRNFSAFVQAVLFDAAYGTNRYIKKFF